MKKNNGRLNQKRREYAPELKKQIMELILQNKKTLSELEQEFNIPYSVLASWSQKIKKLSKISENEKALLDKVKALETQLKQLTKEKERAEMEREILKKATAYFAAINK